MIRARNYVPVDSTGREIPEREYSPLFDMVVNNADVQDSVSGCIEPHWHPQLEVFMLLSGRVDVGIDDQVYTLYPGEGCFINSSVFHFFQANSDEACRFHSFVFDPAIVGGSPGSIFDTMYVRPLMESGPAFIRFSDRQKEPVFYESFEAVYEACYDENPGYEFTVRDNLSRIMALCRTTRMTSGPHNISLLQQNRMKTMIGWIGQHLEEDVTVEDIAASANVCTRECQRIFRQYLHYRPMEYVRRKKILASIDKLMDTDMPVTEISMLYGFISPSYYSKEFKEIVGSTPAQYRKKLQKKIRK